MLMAIRQRKVFCLFFLLALFNASITFSEERFPFLAEATSDKVNVRSGQNTNFEKMASLNKGEVIVVYGKDFDWYKIQIPSKAKIYIRSDYAAISDGATAIVTGTTVNVRAGAGTNFTSVGQLKKDERVFVLGKTGDWLQIQPKEGMFAWVKKDFVEFKSFEIPSMDSLDLLARQKIQLDKTPSTAAILVKTSGKLEPVAQADAPFAYQLTTQGQTVYFINQSAADLSYFLNNQITLEGTILETENPLSAPVLSVSKIMLVL